MRKKCIGIVAFILLLLIVCNNIKNNQKDNNQKDDIPTDKGPKIEFTEENIDDYLGGEIYCSLDSFESLYNAVSKKFETIYLYGEVSSVGTEEWSGHQIRKYIELTNGEDIARYIKIYCDTDDVQEGDIVYVSGFFDQDESYTSDSEMFRTEYKSENAIVTLTKDNEDTYMSVSEVINTLDQCFGTKVKIPGILDAKFHFYCELEADYYENYKGLMCYTSEDLREYDGKWALIEGNLFFNKYGNHGLVNARLVQ